LNEKRKKEEAQAIETTGELRKKAKQAKDDFYFLYDLIKD
jgi:hypothetical protein